MPQVGDVMEGPPGSSIVPLHIHMELCVPDGVVRENLTINLKRPYQRFNELLHASSGVASLVGSGPSLARTYKNLIGDVIACNGALKFLLERGVVPKYALFMDADAVCEKFAVPHPEVTYLVASRCHPKVFDRLAGCNVIVWHAECDAELEELLAGRREPMIRGGSACITRGICVLQCMGYREHHLFGADSSCEGGQTHAMGSLVPEKHLPIFAAGKYFDSTAWLAAQVEDFKIIGPQLEAEGTKFVFHGDGLLPHIARVMGCEVRDDSNSLEESHGIACV